MQEALSPLLPGDGQMLHCTLQGSYGSVLGPCLSRHEWNLEPCTVDLSDLEESDLRASQQMKKFSGPTPETIQGTAD